ncbi:MAG: TIGR02281 family clan AA aspartic protease [Gammaproteobacteria bacterium]|nr:TIGR02281 family clan AA aspartic protease [Gammaproteobacteria bacterium]MCW8922716.1 TIGR02281 family clan AA aspartic protease [Gammaproteobacteria bacterium]
MFLISASPAWANQEIKLQGLFTGKAVVSIDGQRRIIAVGETSPEGVKLIAIASQQATLEIDGNQENYTLGSSISLNFAEAKSVQERVYADDRGMFMSVGSINGQSVRFLLDTGATSVAMNTTQAKRLGVRYAIDGKPMTVSTASGFVKGYQVRLKSVSLGKIKRRNVEAMVIDGQHPGPILLGMTFLGGLKVEKAGNMLTLESR